MKNLKKINDLLDQIIENSSHEDVKSYILEGKTHPGGENWTTFHLKVLKRLINEQ